MNELEQQNRIVKYLGVKPISYGQIYTFQIAISTDHVIQISDERREILRNSFIEKSTNLIPVIVRRTEAYGEEKDYEVVHGVDWYLVAKELEIEKLWVWVFDLNDAQAAAAKVEMEQLLGTSGYIPAAIPSTSEATEQTNILLQKLEKLFREVIKEQNNKIERLSESIEIIKDFLTPPKPPEKLNLLTVTKTEFLARMKEINSQDKVSQAMWNALEYWKEPGRKLSWENLQKSTKSSGLGSIKGFGNGGYEKLREIGYIPD